MLTIAVSMVVLATASSGAQPHWLQSLLASPRANRAVSEHATKGMASPHVPSKTPSGVLGPVRSGTGASVVGSEEASWHAAEDADWALESESRVRVGRLLNRGRYDDAYADVWAFRKARPDLAGATDDMAADCAIMTGRYSEAFDLLLPLVRRPETDFPRVELALSLASAGIGQVYPGQADFCRTHVAQGLSKQCMPDTLAGGLASRADAGAVAALSCLALGLDFGSSPYLELALRLDPQNVMAAHALVFRYTAQGRPADLKRVASGMLKSLSVLDPRREAFREALTGAR